MPNRIEARSAKAALTNATGRLPLLRLFSTPLVTVWLLTAMFQQLPRRIGIDPFVLAIPQHVAGQDRVLLE
jgi:hypothetical protein